MKWTVEQLKEYSKQRLISVANNSKAQLAISQLLLAIASSNLVGRNSKCYFIIKFTLLLSIILCWREVRPDTGKTIKNEFVASFI